ncbi:MAG: sigma-70 family RNA polymerase sigma factor [Acidobacteria bacterium]|nr:sigma-70 family RNA polymerase sigma factor [Acidobacteriota bacterium]
MTNQSPFKRREYFLQAYETAQSYHDKLDLEYDDYVKCLLPIITKYLGEAPQELLLIKFLTQLHTRDLYLTIACAHKSERAWQQFDKLFRGYLLALAKRLSPNIDAARELSDLVFTELFFDDRSRRPRIASYEGQCALSRWLNIVISHRASNERARKFHQLESLEDAPDIEDAHSLYQIEKPLTANRYRPIVIETFKGASASLTEREQYLLLMHYEHQLQKQEIAQLLGIHPANVVRQLQRIYAKLKQEMMTILAKKYHLSPPAIAECVSAMLENPEHSLLEFIKAS